MQKLLLVGAPDFILKIIRLSKNAHFEISFADQNVNSVIRKMTEGRHPSVIVMENRGSPQCGHCILRKLRKLHIKTPVIIVTERIDEGVYDRDFVMLFSDKLTSDTLIAGIHTCTRGP